ncbi:nucleotide-diphospho-sugar transferase [Aspergillus novoparasiticus]|uniref:Nucleotide-diphospho-sugar transferase n=1 Tax=Aspergillus novoparasiticus TaxID=986946 RepID=A0A5N6FAD4_9EURO|nr:nucleotide-diphospho-sugar transferase [Aspergillus novoparasiticus]
MVQDTIEAACTLDYPADRYNVYVLDDKSSAQVETLVKTLQRRFKRLYYASRGLSLRTHAKAGNLNFGLSQTRRHGASQFVAVLDVDMIPEPRWLRALLPHLLQDARAAMANPPQIFYNIPRRDYLGVQLAIKFLFNVLLPLQDANSATFCTGTGFVARRAAIDDIGGFPTESIQEDVHTSMLLSSCGWKVLYVPERLQWGITPHTFKGIIRQRQRILKGAWSLLECLQDGNRRGVSIEHRSALLLQIITMAATAILTTLAMCALPLTLLSQEPLIPVSHPHQMTAMFYLGLCDFVAQLLYGSLEVSMTHQQTYFLTYLSELWLMPYQCITLFTMFVRRKDECFLPSGLSTQSDSPLYRNQQNSLWRRLYFVFTKCHAAGHFVLLTLTVVGVGLLPCHSRGDMTGSIGRDTLLTHAAWPPLLMLWTAIVANTWTPIAHVVVPLETFERRSLLDRNNKSGVLLPSAEARQNESRPVVEWHLRIVVLSWVIAWYLL